MPRPRKGIEKIRCYGFASAIGNQYSDVPTILWAARQDNFGDIEENANVASGVSDTNFSCRRPINGIKVPKPNWLLVDGDGTPYNIISVVADTFRPRTHILIRGRASR